MSRAEKFRGSEVRAVELLLDLREVGWNRVEPSEPMVPDAFRDPTDRLQARTSAVADRFEEVVRGRPEQGGRMLDRGATAGRLARSTAEALA